MGAFAARRLGARPGARAERGSPADARPPRARRGRAPAGPRPAPALGSPSGPRPTALPQPPSCFDIGRIQDTKCTRRGKLGRVGDAMDMPEVEFGQSPLLVSISASIACTGVSVSISLSGRISISSAALV